MLRGASNINQDTVTDHSQPMKLRTNEDKYETCATLPLQARTQTFEKGGAKLRLFTKWGIKLLEEKKNDFWGHN